MREKGDLERNLFQADSIGLQKKLYMFSIHAAL